MSLLTLLGLPLLTCLVLSGILGYLGIHVLKREVIFIDIAVAQVAALGAIAAHLYWGVHGDSATALVCGGAATIVAGLFFAMVRHRVVQLPIEATIGICYALVAAGTLFLIGKCAAGHIHVQTMLAGSLLWVDWGDFLMALVPIAVVAVCFVLFRRRFHRLSDGYEQDLAFGANAVWWDFLFYSLCGIVITVAVNLAGVAVVFCFLIIPSTVSFLFADRWGTRLAIAWGSGALSSVAGLLFCYRMDFSAGVSVSLFLGITLILAALASLFRTTEHVEEASASERDQTGEPGGETCTSEGKRLSLRQAQCMPSCSSQRR